MQYSKSTLKIQNSIAKTSHEKNLVAINLGRPKLGLSDQTSNVTSNQIKKRISRSAVFQ